MRNAANVFTIEKLRKYLNQEKFGFNKTNFTINVNGITHNFSQEYLRLALDGNVEVREKGKNPERIHVYLSNYNWNVNKHNFPIYEAPKPTIRHFTKEELENDHRVAFIFQVMKDILNPGDYQYHLQFLNDNIKGKKLLKTPIYQSGQGYGKDSISTYLMCELFPEISGTLTSIKDFFNNNSQLDDKRFVSISDGNLPKNQDEYNTYKNAVTCTQRQRDVKYEKKTTVKNEINLLFTTNERGKFYSEQNDRRMLFIPISSKYRNSKEIWGDFYLYLSIPEIQEKVKFILAHINTNTDCNYYNNEIAEKYKLRENVDVNTILSIIHILISKKIRNLETPCPYENCISSEDKLRLELIHKTGKITLDEFEVVEEYRIKKKSLLKTLPSNIYEFDFISECSTNKKKIVVDFKKFNEILNYKPTVTPEEFDYLRDVINYIQFPKNLPPDEIDEDSDEVFDEEIEETKNIVEIENVDTNNEDFNLYWGTKEIFSKHSIKDPKRRYDHLNNPKLPDSELQRDEKGHVKRLKDADCCLKNMLFEFDTIDVAEQEKIVTNSNIKPRRCVFSGSKSNHYIIELAEKYCTNKEEYHHLWHYINDNYFNGLADIQCCNPNRLTRHPGGINEKTGKPAELRFISPYVLKINNIDEIYSTLRTKQDKIKKIKQKQQKENLKFNGGVNSNRLMDYLAADEDFALVWNAQPYPSGQRNRLKQHFVGICNSCGMSQSDIESKIIDWLGDVEGENSISSLIN
ncbi:MAG: DUF5906 domain-containing protein [Dysgonamonadaceae bacterium]|jgi:hypothetical protein|nr:DUF5906 domain-containing protein [Dysgonamonadaceae bacterium]